jgi:hypothetical protein
LGGTADVAARVKWREGRGGYADRVRMDWILAGSEFRIKNYRQVLWSVFSFLRVPPDKVCTFFVMKRLPAICGELERFVTAVRLMCPRCDRAWNDKLRVDSPLAYQVLDVIRRWNISRIARAVGGIQNRPGDVLVSDLEQLVRWIYRPFLILGAIGANECFPAILNDTSHRLPLIMMMTVARRGRKRSSMWRVCIGKLAVRFAMSYTRFW